MNVFTKFRQMELFAATFDKKKASGQRSTRRAKVRRRTVRIVVSAFVSALSFIAMFFGVTFGVLDLSALCAASFAVAFCVFEMGGVYPYLVWAVTSTLAFILIPDKLVCFEYLLFAGIYPIVKFRAAKLKTAVCWVIKLACFNAALAGCAAISMWVLGLDADVGITLGWLLFLAGNGMFVLYDMALSGVSVFYLMRLRRTIGADKL